MALLDGLLGGNGSSSSESAQADSSNNDAATNPSFAFGASDVLQTMDSNSDGGNGDSSESSFTGIGDVAFGFEAPTAVSFENASESFNSQDSDGGLLAGLS